MNQNNSALKATTAIVKKNETPFEQALESVLENVSLSIPKTMNRATFVQTLKNMVTKTPQLANCSRQSVMAALVTLAELGVTNAFLIPYMNHKKGIMEAQLQLGYQALLTLAYRSERVISIDAKAVYSGDMFDYEEGTETKLIHKRNTTGMRGEAIGYYAIGKLKDGGIKVEYMSKAEVEDHANHYCKAKDKDGKYVGAWKDAFDEMAKKTVLKKLLKTMPSSIEIERAIEADESVKEYREGMTTMFSIPKDETVFNPECSTAVEYTINGGISESNENVLKYHKNEEVAFGDNSIKEEKKVEGNGILNDKIDELNVVCDVEKIKAVLSENPKAVLSKALKGIVVSVSEDKTAKNDKNITKIELKDDDDFFRSVITLWGHNHDIKIGEEIVLSDITGTVAKNGNLYLMAKGKIK